MSTNHTVNDDLLTMMRQQQQLQRRESSNEVASSGNLNKSASSASIKKSASSMNMNQQLVDIDDENSNTNASLSNIEEALQHAAVSIVNNFRQQQMNLSMSSIVDQQQQETSVGKTLTENVLNSSRRNQELDENPCRDCLDEPVSRNESGRSPGSVSIITLSSDDDENDSAAAASASTGVLSSQPGKVSEEEEDFFNEHANPNTSSSYDHSKSRSKTINPIKKERLSIENFNTVNNLSNGGMPLNLSLNASLSNASLISLSANLNNMNDMDSNGGLDAVASLNINRSLLGEERRSDENEQASSSSSSADLLGVNKDRRVSDEYSVENVDASDEPNSDTLGLDENVPDSAIQVR